MSAAYSQISASISSILSQVYCCFISGSHHGTSASLFICLCLYCSYKRGNPQHQCGGRISLLAMKITSPPAAARKKCTLVTTKTGVTAWMVFIKALLKQCLGFKVLSSVKGSVRIPKCEDLHPIDQRAKLTCPTSYLTSYDGSRRTCSCELGLYLDIIC